MARSYGNAPDGGWGWMVLLSAHCMHFMVAGMDRTAGVFYREILSDLKQTSASTAGFSALLFSSRYLSSPVAGVLCKYWGCRTVMMAGGVLAGLGVMLSSFSRSMALINLTLGLMMGVGNGLAYTAGLLALNEYFNRRKATALGVATAGTGVGSFVLPLLIQHLIKVYSYRGCMMIVSGLSLNLVVCGALLYPLPPSQPAEAEEVEILAPEPPEESKHQRFCTKLWAKLDLKLFLNLKFTLFAAAGLFISAGFKPVTVFLPHHAQLRGLDGTTSVLLISISGAFDTISRLSLGFLFDIPCLLPHRRRIWSLSMLLTAASCAAFGFMQSLLSFVVAAVAFGLASGLFGSQQYCMLSDLIGRERTRTGLGLMILCRGFGVAIGPPLAGAIKDATGSYQLSFCSLGAFAFCGFMSLCALDIIISASRSRSARNTDRPPEIA